MKSERKQILVSFLALTIVLLCWEMVVRYGTLSAHVLPGPVIVFNSLTELMADGSLFRHTIASLFRVTAGFYIAILLGIPFGIILGRIQIAAHIFKPIISFLSPISPLAWIPLAMLWFGIGDMPAIFLIFLASFFPITMATTIAVRSINPTYFHVATNFDFSRYEVFRKIVLPAITPPVITALRLTINIAWLVVVAAEMIAVQSGLGYLILDSRNALRMDYVMGGMIVIGIIGLLLNFIMRRLAHMDSASWARQ